MEINNASMDYPLDWRQVFVTIFSLDIILKFSKIEISELEFSDSPTQTLLFFLVEKNGRATRTEYFLDDRRSKNVKLKV